jgi:hypothetical protein
LSNGGAADIKKETLYMLAFAAGLLSEQAFSLIINRALAGLRDKDKSNALPKTADELEAEAKVRAEIEEKLKAEAEAKSKNTDGI